MIHEKLTKDEMDDMVTEAQEKLRWLEAIRNPEDEYEDEDEKGKEE